MSSRGGVLLVLLCGLASRLVAQIPDRAELEDRYRRALAQQESLQTGRASALVRAREAMQIGRSGPVLVLLPEALAAADAERVAGEVDEAIRDLGPFPNAMLAQIALVAAEGDLRAVSPGIEGRTELEFPLPGGRDRPPAVLAANAADRLMRAIVMRDPVWDTWIRGSLETRWTRRHAQVALSDLVLSTSAGGRSCVSGDAGACAAWLGVDETDDPVGRFSVADIRRGLSGAGYSGSASSERIVERCRSGSDPACREWFQVVYERHAGAPAVLDAAARPATPAGARSLLHFVRERDGPEALVALLSDTVGTIGARVARATGLERTAIGGTWRAWLIARAGREPVHAGIAEVTAAAFAVGVMLLLATRGGRWRA
jgi:hypothetical protein